tara:strand:+ start:279 stop:1067 length:789 start_codon:yes stop_codon:yes gene_type:complete
MQPQLSFSDDFDGILELVEQLRAKEGCPWDQEQTLQTLSPLLLEECYELIESIESESESGRLEELGDVFLHLAFQISISEEEGSFTRSDVFTSTLRKYIDRHPHVFAGEIVNSLEELKDNWEKIKREEKKESRKSTMDGIPQNLPSLSSAQKIQQKAARSGFDWDNSNEIRGKILEELYEFESAETYEEIEEEFGDLLFSIVNMGRHSKIDSEKALRNANRKFVSRFKSMEKLATQQGKQFSELPLKSQDDLWNQVKSQEDQ